MVHEHRIAVTVDEDGSTLFVKDGKHRRRDITSCRDALNGYQKGHCFYCQDAISITSGDDALAQVDHFFPHKLKPLPGWGRTVDGVWNLVLACRTCNAGVGGKFARVPSLRLLERLSTRNNYFIQSHHPLRETLMRQTGKTVSARHTFLQKRWEQAKNVLIHEWEPEPVAHHEL